MAFSKYPGNFSYLVSNIIAIIYNIWCKVYTPKSINIILIWYEFYTLVFTCNSAILKSMLFICTASGLTIIVLHFDLAHRHFWCSCKCESICVRNIIPKIIANGYIHAYGTIIVNNSTSNKVKLLNKMTMLFYFVCACSSFNSKYIPTH